jgi:hypothetical protein
MNKGRLPEDLSLLQDDIRGIVIPTDPKTGENYNYEVKGALSFSLCATFDRPSPESEAGIGKPRPPEPFGYGIQQNWQHGAGYTCFERTIDEDFYKTVKQR